MAVEIVAWQHTCSPGVSSGSTKKAKHTENRSPVYFINEAPGLKHSIWKMR